MYIYRERERERQRERERESGGAGGGREGEGERESEPERQGWTQGGEAGTEGGMGRGREQGRDGVLLTGLRFKADWGYTGNSTTGCYEGRMCRLAATCAESDKISRCMSQYNLPRYLCKSSYGRCCGSPLGWRVWGSVCCENLTIAKGSAKARPRQQVPRTAH